MVIVTLTIEETRHSQRVYVVAERQLRDATELEKDVSTLIRQQINELDETISALGENHIRTDRIE